jgi:hypothetical protein
MIASKFDPLKNGLPYKNGSFKFKVGPANCSVLCGGISYTALDYFYTGIQPPKSPKTPAEGNPMEEYLYRRQATAHFYTWHRFAAAWSGSLPLIGPVVSGVEQDSLEDLCRHLASRPVILCLYGVVGEGHHVVASACDQAKKQIQLYDSNHPGKISLLTQVSGGWLHKQFEQKVERMVHGLGPLQRRHEDASAGLSLLPHLPRAQHRFFGRAGRVRQRRRS